MLRPHMGAFARLRAQRRLSGVVVVALLILGGISAAHHHRLMPAADALAFATTAQGEHPSRTADCVVCRAADPAPVVVVGVRLPHVVVTRLVVSAVSEEKRQAAFRPSHPRAPPAIS